jgi:L-serine dehydratase
MPILFDSFDEWRSYCDTHALAIWEPVMIYEKEQRGRSEGEIWAKLAQAYAVMKDAVHTGLEQDMTSISGMINNGGKKVRDCKVSVLGENFQKLVSYTLAAKELNACMGRVVAAPTAGASGIMPGMLVTLEELHGIPHRKMLEGMLVSAGIALIIEKRASIAGAVGGCQAETGTAAAMGAGAVVYCLDGTLEQVFEAVAITIMNMLGLICDPVAAAQIALAGDSAVIPVDEVIDAMGEVGASMEDKYKETALGGIANTPTARAIENRVLIQKVEEVEE